jgi:hypothetical protein
MQRVCITPKHRDLLFEKLCKTVHLAFPQDFRRYVKRVLQTSAPATV